MRKKSVYVLWKVNVKVLLGAILCAAVCAAAVITVSAATGEDGVELPVVMYHAVLKDEKYHGKYVISPAEFENDMTYLKKHGYTTVLIEDLIRYTRDDACELPEKPILITFDDGYYNNYLYAFEIAKQMKCKFVISPIGYYADLYTDTPDENAYYSHATWDQLREMTASGLVEVQNHSYDLHESGGVRLGAKKLPGETEEQYEAFLKDDLGKAQEAIENGVGIRPTAFAYPFGAASKATPGIVKEMGFVCTLTCEERISRITRDPESLYDLGRFLRPSGGTSQDFFEKRMKLG